MKKNTLVVCGGTGAHVALALVRLHTLGHALGFFRGPGGQPLAFPTIWLVDQDSGDGDGEDTAWQLARRLVDSHPGRHDWQAAIGRSDPPELKIVTPLPVGPDRSWFNPPFDTLGQRFADSPYLDLLASRAQRDIRFSLGMMGSPAVGSLLFRLKEFDTKPGGAGTNHDGAYHELLTTSGRVAVVGSAVGGTGASVAPTLAQRFAGIGDDVMAVMVLSWFRFEPEGLDEATLEKAQLRDRSMLQNANSAFAYYGRRLARRVATVPVGVPSAGIKVRRYTSDARQPIRESFVHGVAALCALQHFLDREPCSPGLYQMGAEDPTRLGGGNRLPGGAGNDTVQSLANQAATLADVLDVFARTLAAEPGGGLFRVAPAICSEVGRLAAPDRVGQALAALAADYRKHVEWLKDVGVEPRPDLSLTREALSRERLATHRLEAGRRGGAPAEEAAALALLHWTADWIREFSLGQGAGALVVPPAKSASGGYWPPLAGHDSLTVAAEKPGQLTQVPDQNIVGTVQGFIREEDVAQNGWPDPLAAADHFRYAIEHEHPAERRQLGMLLAGVVMGKLALRDVSPRANAPLLSLDRVVADCRKTDLPDVARVAVVHEHPGGEVVLGFNSPHTLLCPVPIAGDEEREGAWGALWQALTGSGQPRDWRTEDVGEWRPAHMAIRRIRTWIEGEKRAHGGTSPPWTQVFADGSAPAPTEFGRGATLSVYWGTGADARPVEIALPTARSGDYWPDEQTPSIAEDELLGRAPALASATAGAVTFRRVEFTLPGREQPTRAFWREHLEHLQRSGHINAFGVRADERRLAVLTADRRSAAILDDVIVLDRDDMMVRDCSPMRQDPAPGSSTRPGRVRYPDYPLRSDFLGLVETDDGRRVVDLLKRGEPVRAARPSIDEGPQRPPAGSQPAAPAASTRQKEPRDWAAAAGSVLSAGLRAAGGITEAVRDTLRRGPSAGEAPPPEAPSAAGEPRRQTAKATWSLRLAGRSDLLRITLTVPPVDAPGEEDEHHRAHWMVWPRFRSQEAPFWRAYYVYEHCSDARLRLSTLWFDPDDDRVRRCKAHRRAGSHPVDFSAGERRAHTGGPPIAFSLENPESGRELGLYLINLECLSRRHDDVKVGLDFGTSHTVASVRVDGSKQLVGLPPEFASPRHDALTLHVSENWSHVTGGDGLKALGIWLPTYSDEPVSKATEGLLPSELLTIEPLDSLSSKEPSEWQPGRDCVIPFMNMQRRDLADHLLSDFKWQASSPAFRQKEPALREVYLGMAIELVLADVVWRRLRALPARVGFTFTYPLRNSPDEVQDYERTLRQVTDSGTRSLGCALGLTDDVGIYNESSAARGGTDVFGEVCLVGDLGGGTLDLFISAWGGGLIVFEEVADSAKLGGNELLRTMAVHPGLFLPEGAGWARRPGEVETQLRAWMRSKGAARLFGDGAGRAERHAGLGVTGFAKPAAAKAARALIERYFRLIVEYMARSLVAYLVRHWYPTCLEKRPHDIGRLRVLVQLRGNGWRLWHENQQYDEIEQEMARRIQARAAELWQDDDAWRDVADAWRLAGRWNDADGGAAVGPPVGAPDCSAEGSHDAHPKAAPIVRVVGEAQPHDAIRCYSHALVELALLTEQGPAPGGGPARICWFDRLPVHTGGAGVQVEFHDIRPPFVLSHPDARDRRELADLESGLKKEINHGLKEQGRTSEVDFHAPIAALVWEQAFKSDKFVKGE